MGQPVTVVEKPSSRSGILRFEVNRSLTGMGHERFRAGQPVDGSDPSHELARRLLDLGGVAGIHVNSNMVTVEVAGDGPAAADVAGVIAGLFTYYVEGVEVPSDEDLVGASG